MRHFILLICLLWVSPCFAGWNPYVIGSGTGGASYSLVLDDTLYEGSTIAIASHTVTPGPGGGWTQGYGDTVSVRTTGASVPTTTQSGAFAGPYGVADGYSEIECVLNSTVATASCAAGVRLSNDGGGVDGYYALLVGDGAFGIREMTNSTSSTLINATGCPAIVSTTTYVVKLEAAGITLTASLYADDRTTLLCSVSTTDTTVASGSFGIRMSASNPRITDIKGYESQ